MTKIVFIASDPKGYLKNFVDLGRASNATFVGDPFMPTAIQVLAWLSHSRSLLTYYCSFSELLLNLFLFFIFSLCLIPIFFLSYHNLLISSSFPHTFLILSKSSSSHLLLISSLYPHHLFLISFFPHFLFILTSPPHLLLLIFSFLTPQYSRPWTCSPTPPTT